FVLTFSLPLELLSIDSTKRKFGKYSLFVLIFALAFRIIDNSFYTYFFFRTVFDSFYKMQIVSIFFVLIFSFLELSLDYSTKRKFGKYSLFILIFCFNF